MKARNKVKLSVRPREQNGDTETSSLGILTSVPLQEEPRSLGAALPQVSLWMETQAWLTP